MNVATVVDEYYANYSKVIVSWDSPPDNVRVDYYQYHLTYEPLMTQNNVTNTSQILSNVPYNENITFVLVAANCIGKSSPVFHTFNIGMI